MCVDPGVPAAHTAELRTFLDGMDQVEEVQMENTLHIKAIVIYDT